MRPENWAYLLSNVFGIVLRVVLKSVTETGMAETACCLATRLRSRCFRCANDLAEGGICLQPDWPSDNLSCVEGGDGG